VIVVDVGVGMRGLHALRVGKGGDVAFLVVR